MPVTSPKIVGLERMRDLGLPVPPFEVIPDFESLDDAAPTVDILRPDWPPLRRALVYATEILRQVDAHGLSLRSAAADEDTVQTSSAGRYLTFNGLSGVESLSRAAVAIWRQHRANSAAGDTCALILQATHPSYFGGVLATWSTTNGTGAPRAHLAIESYYGSSRSVVDGLVVPFRSELAHSEWTHSFHSTVTKSRFVAHSDLFRSRSRLPAPGEPLEPLFEPFAREVRVYQPSSGLELQLYGTRPMRPPHWYGSVCDQLVLIAQRLDPGGGVDIEWGCSPAAELVLYQVRPLTRQLTSVPTQSPGTSHNRPASSQVVTGLPAAPGRTRGRIWTLKEGPAPADPILLIPGALRPDAQTLSGSRGVITMYGGILSHIAIACREMGIPCVTAVEVALPDGVAVDVDGDRGTVTPVVGGTRAIGPSRRRSRKLVHAPLKSGAHRKVVNETLWLFDLSTRSDNSAWVHVPLVYATNMSVQHEAYANALLTFAHLIDNNRSLQGSLVGDVVFRYDLAGYHAFRSACLAKVVLDRQFAAEIAERYISIRRRLPLTCLAAEESIVVSGRVDQAVTSRLFCDVVEAIAINLANPFVESAVVLAREMFGADDEFDSLYRRVVGPPSFSHMSYFASEEQRLRKRAQRGSVTAGEIQRFAWVAGFLGGGEADRSPFESASYVARQMGLASDRLPVDDSPSAANILPPNCAMDPTGLTDEWADDDNAIVRLLLLLRALQVGEEFRHYWQARVMRLFRLLAGDDWSAESQHLAEYCQSNAASSPPSVRGGSQVPV
jgi:pyruvate,water dikinase